MGVALGSRAAEWKDMAMASVLVHAAIKLACSFNSSFLLAKIHFTLVHYMDCVIIKIGHPND